MRKLAESELPGQRSRAITIDRVVPYWTDVIDTHAASGEKVIIAATVTPAALAEMTGYNNDERR